MKHFPFEGRYDIDERLAYQKLNDKPVFHQKAFQELTVDELYELLRVRSEVFVVEQNCVYQDLDGDDQESIHLWLTVAGNVVALARVCPAGTHMQQVSRCFMPLRLPKSVSVQSK